MPTRKWIIWIAVFVVVMAGTIVFAGSVAPRDFPDGTSVDVLKGSTLTTIAKDLAGKGIVKSSLLFRIYATLIEGSSGVKTGQYLFEKPESVLRVAYRLVNGFEGYPQTKITIPEGSSVADIARIVAKDIPGFDQKGFIRIAKDSEGYLFPDTYFWMANVTPDKVMDDMRSLFDVKTAALDSAAATSSRTFEDLIKMASIIEREATSTEDRKIISGILWKRLGAGIALQADATFYYALGTTTKALTLDDLKMDSPYNLYTHTGLPPTPISNPGLEAITDALYPTKTRYLYYLSGKDGATHYAETLDWHIANKVKYLR